MSNPAIGPSRMEIIAGNVLVGAGGLFLGLIGGVLVALFTGLIGLC